LPRYFFHTERRRVRAAAIGTTRPFGDSSATAARARSRPCNASSLCNASTALSMKRSTSTSSKSASSSAAASTSGVTQRAHRRKGSCPIPAFVAEAAPLSRQCECIHGAGTSGEPARDRIAQSTLHDFRVRHLDVQRRLEPCDVARKLGSHGTASSSARVPA
jgi:hypothetical protein